MKRLQSRSGYMHISCAGIVDWLLIWYWQYVGESDLCIDWCKWSVKTELFVTSFQRWYLDPPESAIFEIFISSIKDIKKMSGVRVWNFRNVFMHMKSFKCMDKEKKKIFKHNIVPLTYIRFGFMCFLIAQRLVKSLQSHCKGIKQNMQHTFNRNVFWLIL